MKHTTVRLLLIEDDDEDAELLLEDLRRPGVYRFQVDWARSFDRAADLLDVDPYDLVVTDLNLPDSDGVSTLVRLRTTHPEIPIVVLSGNDDAATAILALKQGAQDFLVKGRADRDRIARAVGYAMERHRIDERARQQTAELRAFNHVVTHDLRAPLISIDYLVSEVDERLRAGDAEGAARQLDSISSCVGTMDALIQGIQAMATIDDSERDEEVQLDATVTSVVNDLRGPIEARGIDLRVDLAHLPPLRADPLQLRQLMANLIGNAVKYTRDNGGTVDVRARCRRGPATPTWRIEVSDNGPGVPPDQRARIFEMFERAPDPLARGIPGTGIGLAIAAKVARRLGTCIVVEDVPGGGALFAFDLPPGRLVQSPHRTTTDPDTASALDPSGWG